MNDYNLVLAVSIKERIECLKSRYQENNEECLQGIQIWKEKKTIVKPEQFEWMLFANELSIESFGIGVKKLNHIDIELLYHFIQSEPWYKLHREVFENVEHYQGYKNEEGFRFFARPYLNWFRRQIEGTAQKAAFKIDNKVLTEFIEATFKEIVGIAKKTIVYDQLEEYELKDTEENWFLKYAEDRFSDEASYNIFFNDYPVLARLLSTRIHYAVINFQELVRALEESKEECKQKFCIEGNLCLQSIELNKGDSHGGGKSVILLTINGIKLVFKYKNLEVGNRLNDFFTFVEELNPSISFYKIKRVTAPNYTIEEFVGQKPCQSIQDVSLFYRHFGQLVCLTYVLRGNDFHLENLISAKEYPVLIDVETIIQNAAILKDSGKAKNQYLLSINNSILGTCLLPNIIGNRQKETNIEFSALSGDDQLLPYKVLRLTNDNKGKMRMEYQEHSMEGAGNLPILNGKKINYANYTHDILQGFSETYKVIYEYKDLFISKSEELFSGMLVRNVLKSTQKYAEMLDYSHHPGYMTNYMNREKLFENIWAYPHNNPIVIKYEIEDLLVNDIPIFYNKTNEKSIITSQGNNIFSFYPNNAVENVKQRLQDLSAQDFLLQKNRLYMALGMYHGEISPVEIEKGNNKYITPLEKAKQIVDYICKNIVWGSDKQDITLPTYLVDEDKKWKCNVMTHSFYDGLSGIYILLNQFVKFYPEKQYIELLHIMDKMFFKTIRNIESIEQYTNYLSLLYVISCKLDNVFNIKDVLVGKRLLNEIKIFYSKSTFTDEWLFGRASLIKVCLKFYQTSGLEDSLIFAKVVVNDIQIHKMDNIGFAHGYAGVVYSLACVFEYLEQDQLQSSKAKMKAFFDLIEDISYLDDDEINESWCNGLAGIGFAQLKLWQIRKKIGWKKFHMNENVIERIINAHSKDDCICHGNFGRASFLQDVLQHGEKTSIQKVAIIEKQKNLFDNYIQYYFVKGMKGEPVYGLMIGLAGIAYEFLRYEDPTIPNVLLLD